MEVEELLTNSDALVTRLQEEFREYSKVLKSLKSIRTELKKSYEALKPFQETSSSDSLESHTNTVKSICMLLEEVNNGLRNLETKHIRGPNIQDASAYQMSSSSSQNMSSCEFKVSEIPAKFSRWVRAKRILRKLNDVMQKAKKLDSKVHELVPVVNSASAEAESQTGEDLFVPNFCSLHTTHAVLDFASLSTFEGDLKAMLLDTEAYAVSFSAKDLGKAEDSEEAEDRGNAEGVHKAENLGKSEEAKEVLAKVEDLANAFHRDDEINAKFHGGIYVMSFEQNIMETKDMKTIVKIVNSSPKNPHKAKPEKYCSAERAAHMPAENLPKEPCLIFCDDILLNDPDVKVFQGLRRLFRDRIGSKLVVLTKSISGAALAGCKVSSTFKDLRANLLKFRKTFGISGSGGVGKTVVLTSLAEEREIVSRFNGGVYFMSFGAEATIEHVVEEIAKIIESSRGYNTARSIRNSDFPVLKVTVKTASDWFSRKACLFLCDDLWDSASHTDVFPELKMLTMGHRDSRMVFTARDPLITGKADSQFVFEPRSAVGPVAKGIFLHYAEMEESDDLEFQNNLNTLLRLCGGLPLLLSVLGRKLAEEKSSDRDSIRMENLAKEMNRELEEDVPNEINRVLYKALMLSVQYLDKKFATEIREYSFAEMFRSLSILSKQGWIPISVLSRLWKVDALKYVEYFSRFSLVTLKSRSWKNHLENKEEQEQGVMVHDLTLDICRMDARLPSRHWHEALLGSYLEAEPGETEVAKSVGSDCILSLSDNHRDWWSDDVPEDGYIHSNLSRHLVAASRINELWSLLLNPKWSNVWIRFGTFLPLHRGLASLRKEMNRKDGLDSKKRRNMKTLLLNRRKMKTNNEENLGELELIYRALRCAWGRIEKCPREYPYQMLGRLFDARQSMKVVHFFLEKLEESTQKPWLKPLHQCLQDPREGPEMEVYFDSSCSSVAYFPCGEKVAAAVGNEVRVIDLQHGETLVTYPGHEKPVRKASVCSKGEWLISSDENDIRVWGYKSGGQVGYPIKCDNSVKPADGSLVIRECSKDLEASKDLESSRDLEGSKDLESSKDLEIFGVVQEDVVRWKLKSGRKLPRITDESTNYIEFSADGRELVCAAVRAEVVRVLNMDNLNAKAEEMKCPPAVTCIAVSPDGKSIACGTFEGKIVFWDRNFDVRQGGELSGHSGTVTALAISENAKLILSGSTDGGVRMWDLRNGDKPVILIGKHANSVTSLAVSPNNTRLVSGSRDSTLRVWDLTKDTYANNGNRNPNCHSGPVTCIASCPKGGFVISGGEDGKVCVWDPRNGKPVGQPFTGHKDPIEEVDVSSDSTIAYSFSGIVALCWNMETRAAIPLRFFSKANCSDKHGHPLSLQESGNDIVECNYKSCDGDMYPLAQFPTQEKCLPWHIDQVRQIVYVGRQDGTIMVLKVQR